MEKAFRAMHILFLHFRWNMSLSSARMIQNSFAADYKKKMVPYLEIWKIHRRGFTVQNWHLMGLNETTCKKYLSNVDYCKMHPINGEFGKWIDDKLTLKYLCAGTELDQYMPDYFYQIDKAGKLLCLCDCPVKKRDVTAQDIAALLEEKGTLAIKLVAGSIGKGFFKAEYKDGSYCLNEKQYDLQGFCNQIGKLRNYLVIEYLRPHAEIAKICPDTVNCIRYLAARQNGMLKMVKGYIRFGTKSSGFVENYNAGGVLCYLDNSGAFTSGNIIDPSGLVNCVIHQHPDTATELNGAIPMWDEIEKAVKAFDIYFPQMKYMGIDFVVTSDNQVKILEINSLTSLDGFQMKGSIFETEFAEFYRNLMV